MPPGRAGQVPSAGQGQRGRSAAGTPQIWLLFADLLLQQEQKLAGQALLASLASPNPSFSLFAQTSSAFLSKLRGLAPAPRLWRQQLAKLRVLAQSLLQLGSLRTQGWLSCLPGQGLCSTSQRGTWHHPNGTQLQAGAGCKERRI